MERLLKTKEAAEFLGLSKAWLERDRWVGPTVPFIRVGKRSPRYRMSDLENYLEENLQRSTTKGV